MQERRVTVARETRELPNPFFVVATQNPIEHEGTYPLPEAQLDRFMFFHRRALSWAGKQKWKSCDGRPLAFSRRLNR